jgi:hypothetical protein
MPVRVDPSPNPNAMKFTVGVAVGGPGTVSRGGAPSGGYADRLLELEGVMSVFFTADFVTLTKTASSDWDRIVPPAVAILETEFGG